MEKVHFVGMMGKNIKEHFAMIKDKALEYYNSNIN